MHSIDCMSDSKAEFALESSTNPQPSTCTSLTLTNQQIGTEFSHMPFSGLGGISYKRSPIRRAMNLSLSSLLSREKKSHQAPIKIVAY